MKERLDVLLVNNGLAETREKAKVRFKELGFSFPEPAGNFIFVTHKKKSAKELFAALRALESGLKPIVIERGQPVEQRRLDIAQLGRTHQVNPESKHQQAEHNPYPL